MRNCGLGCFRFGGSQRKERFVFRIQAWGLSEELWDKSLDDRKCVSHTFSFHKKLCFENVSSDAQQDVAALLREGDDISSADHGVIPLVLTKKQLGFGELTVSEHIAPPGVVSRSPALYLVEKLFRFGDASIGEIDLRECLANCRCEFSACCRQ